MTRQHGLGSIAILALIAATPGAATAQDPPRTPDFKVAIWYKRADPLGTFQHRNYDVRKGQYDARKVDAWLQTIRTGYPADFAYVLDVFLDRQAGATEAEKLANAIRKERSEMAAVRAIPRPSLTITPTTARIPSRTANVPSMTPNLGLPARFQPSYRWSPGAGGSSSGYQPPGPSFPVPFPYPRPHP